MAARRKTTVGIGLAFTPTWFQVFPGVDLSAPVTYSRGHQRQRADHLRRQPRLTATTASVLRLDIFQKYRVDLKYIDFYGTYKDNGICGDRAERLHDAAERPRLHQPDIQGHLLKDTTMKLSRKLLITALAATFAANVHSAITR